MRRPSIVHGPYCQLDGPNLKGQMYVILYQNRELTLSLARKLC